LFEIKSKGIDFQIIDFLPIKRRYVPPLVETVHAARLAEVKLERSTLRRIAAEVGVIESSWGLQEEAGRRYDVQDEDTSWEAGGTVAFACFGLRHVQIDGIAQEATVASAGVRFGDPSTHVFERKLVCGCVF